MDPRIKPEDEESLKSSQRMRRESAFFIEIEGTKK